MEEPSLPTTQPPNTSEQHNEALILTASAIITGIWGPLILYILWKDKNPLAGKVGKSVINAELSLMILSLIVGLGLLLLAMVIGVSSAPGAMIALFIIWFLFALFILGVNIMITVKVANKAYDQVKVPFFHFEFLK